jgi:hypothetical protein
MLLSPFQLTPKQKSSLIRPGHDNTPLPQGRQFKPVAITPLNTKN